MYFIERKMFMSRIRVLPWLDDVEGDAIVQIVSMKCDEADDCMVIVDAKCWRAFRGAKGASSRRSTRS
jgi:hypothetical protein